jgi:hypothetical protein
MIRPLRQQDSAMLVTRMRERQLNLGHLPFGAMAADRPRLEHDTTREALAPGELS